MNKILLENKKLFFKKLIFLSSNKNKETININIPGPSAVLKVDGGKGRKIFKGKNWFLLYSDKNEAKNLIF